MGGWLGPAPRQESVNLLIFFNHYIVAFIWCVGVHSTTVCMIG